MYFAAIGCCSESLNVKTMLLRNIPIKSLKMNIFKLICATHMYIFETNFLWSWRQFHKLFSHVCYGSVLFLLHPFEVAHPRSKTCTFLWIYNGGAQRKWTISQMFLILDHEFWSRFKADTYA